MGDRAMVPGAFPGTTLGIRNLTPPPPHRQDLQVVLNLRHPRLVVHDPLLYAHLHVLHRELLVVLAGTAPNADSPVLPQPIYFQAVRNHDATQSGVDILAFCLATVLSVIICGRLVSVLGRYWYFLVLGPIPGAIGAGLMYTVKVGTSTSNVIGYQILLGVGVGTVMQNGIFAVSAEFKDNMRLLGQATGLASFSQFLGGTIALAIGQAALSTQLTQNFARYAPEAPVAVIEQSPLKIWDLPEAIRSASIYAYVESLRIGALQSLDPPSARQQEY